MVKDGNYVTIQSFMVNELHLKGNELIVYAVIYGYTQDGSHWYYGTRGHLAEWCGATRGTVSNCLKSLMAKGYIRRREIERHGCVEVQYQVVADSISPIANFDTGGIKNSNAPLSNFSSNNNKGIYNKNNPNNKEEVELDGELGEYADALDFQQA